MRAKFAQFLGLAFACAALVWCAQACIPATAPEPPARAQVRAYIMAVAGGVVVADETCALVAKGRRSLKLAEQCGHAYQIARASLIAAEDAIDITGERNAACIAADGALALHDMAAIIASGGIDVPPAIVDGEAMARALAALIPCADAGLL